MTKKIDVFNNSLGLQGSGELVLVPGRNMGVDAAMFASRFYGKDGKPTAASAHLFEGGPGKLPIIQVVEAANLLTLPAGDAIKLVGEINDQRALEIFLQTEKREEVVSALKAQKEKLSKSTNTEKKVEGEEKPAEAPESSSGSPKAPVRRGAGETTSPKN